MNNEKSYDIQAIDECNFPLKNLDEAVDELKTINEVEPIKAQDLSDDLVEAVINLI
ncbi:MAG: hypothetical protein WC389_21640 [Lutibacter sp.]|jgi:hypothetical protein